MADRQAEMNYELFNMLRTDLLVVTQFLVVPLLSVVPLSEDFGPWRSQIALTVA